MERALRWVHISDFHQGVSGQDQDWLWPQVQPRFHEDARAMAQKGGPFDLIFFTGDLTQSAQPEQFTALTAMLDALVSELSKVGPPPVVLAVPGNHDLVRPSTAATTASSDAMDKLKGYWEPNSDLREQLWVRPRLTARSSLPPAALDSEREVIQAAFRNYGAWQSAWYAAHPLPTEGALAIDMNRDGLFVGDFSAGIECRGLRIHVLGLNSALLQLDGGYYRGKLAVHSRQAQQLRPADWATGYDTSLLLTHHPVDWLHRNSRREHFEPLFDPRSVAAHLCGHMHASRYECVSQGGSADRLSITAASLFSADRWGKGQKQKRIFGYNLGELAFSDGSGVGRVKIWPRKAEKLPNGTWDIQRESRIEYAEDESLRQVHSVRRVRQIVPSAQSVVQSYVERVTRHIESRPGNPEYAHKNKPLVLCERAYAHRQAILSAIKTRYQGPGSHVVQLYCSSLVDSTNRQQPLGELIRQVGRELARTIVSSETLNLFMREQWQPGNTGQSLTDLLLDLILPRLEGRLVLIWDEFEKLQPRIELDESMRSLFRVWWDRACSESGPPGGSMFQKLHVVLVMPRQPPDREILGSAFQCVI